MLFQDVAPARGQVHAEVAAALQNEKFGIFLDSSLLLHCYEVSPEARDELLAAVQRFVPRLHIPMWVAQETWRHGQSKKSSERPLVKHKDAIQAQLDKFVKSTLRYHGDQVEPPRLSRRLLPLRGWSHDQSEQVFP